MDPDIANKIAELRMQSFTSNAETAKQLAKAENRLRLQSEQMNKLLEFKQTAIDNEDYLSAKNLKRQFEQLKQQALDGITHEEEDPVPVKQDKLSQASVESLSKFAKQSAKQSSI
jgi:Holliday junction resolvase